MTPRDPSTQSDPLSTSGWEELNKTRRPESQDPDTPSAPQERPMPPPADPFRVLIGAAVAFVAIGGIFMVLSGVFGASPSDSEASPDILAFENSDDYLSSTYLGDVEGSTTTSLEDTASPGGVPASLLDAEQAQILRLYMAALGRAPDGEGFAHWTSQLRQGTPIEDIASRVLRTEEFRAQFDGNPSRTAFIDALHQNMFGRDATDAELQIWLTTPYNEMPLLAVLISFAESEQSATATGTIAN